MKVKGRAKVRVGQVVLMVTVRESLPEVCVCVCVIAGWLVDH